MISRGTEVDGSEKERLQTLKMQSINHNLNHQPTHLEPGQSLVLPER